MKLSLAQNLLFAAVGLSAAVAAYPYSELFGTREQQLGSNVKEHKSHPSFALDERDVFDENLYGARDFDDYIFEARDFDDMLEDRDFDDEMLDARDYEGYEFKVRDLNDTPLEARDFYTDEMLEARAFIEGTIEARNYEFTENDLRELHPRMAAGIVRGVVKGITKIVKLITGRIQADKDARSKFTVQVVGEFAKKYPNYNIVVCHTDHTKQFNGAEGKDWGHKHQEFGVGFGKTVGYEIYWFKGGWFQRKGDGGYLNWAYRGKVLKTEDGGKRITFGA
ncbi:hypothetical protein BDQ12DRAFT_738343 [Crucibulum laeve]|uniref:Uncharacterized protein n=1 Tax=Crucibulum laeve TaxID=68775 RepID=A0A5C3LLY9_9AGAR|nr:hypothetical protein BDQ12DRAFT_738343 [Crucibulum laeve]